MVKPPYTEGSPVRLPISFYIEYEKVGDRILILPPLVKPYVPY